jgi:hypothetical protein
VSRHARISASTSRASLAIVNANARSNARSGADPASASGSAASSSATCAAPPPRSRGGARRRVHEHRPNGVEKIASGHVAPLGRVVMLRANALAGVEAAGRLGSRGKPREAVAGMARFYFVECDTGRIRHAEVEPGASPEPAAFVAGARALDERLGRFGRSYVGHERNPEPGETLGYYVYRADTDEADDGDASSDAPVRHWQLLGFVEVIPSAVVDRVWLEPDGVGFIVHTTTAPDRLTADPVPRADAERIAREFAARTGAYFDPA